ncbi:hypothetical protein [Nocardioides sp. AE5]|uniref:hypothetical protein n=1 Tax=Nocardioides sp. AE5 TaxID=2962573 RepID=UPI002882661E|nr:hypothetical protein [Nocardioides sp. AE5]MDT0202784.1 hypothetical protein [Nocardioides sp. AE5]
MSTTSPAAGLLRDLVDLPWRLLGLSRAPLALAGPAVRRDPDEDAVVLRSGGRDVATTPEEVERAFPHATGRLVLFVPDAGQDESAWTTHLDQVGGTYPSRLASLLEWTPVHVLPHAGLRPSEVAVDLVATVQELVDVWPVPLTRIALVGHGTGGLVLRAACAVDALGGESWLSLVEDVVLLGTPHLVVPGSGPALARQLDQELAGIVTEEYADPQAPALPGARYELVVDRNQTRSSLIGGLVGGLLWWRQRLPTRPRTARELFPTASVHHVESRQTTLVNHPEVHQALLGWLA